MAEELEADDQIVTGVYERQARLVRWLEFRLPAEFANAEFIQLNEGWGLLLPNEDDPSGLKDLQPHFPPALGDYRVRAVLTTLADESAVLFTQGDHPDTERVFYLSPSGSLKEETADANRQKWTDTFTLPPSHQAAIDREAALQSRVENVLEKNLDLIDAAWQAEDTSKADTTVSDDPPFDLDQMEHAFAPDKWGNPEAFYARQPDLYFRERAEHWKRVRGFTWRATLEGVVSYELLRTGINQVRFAHTAGFGKAQDLLSNIPYLAGSAFGVAALVSFVAVNRAVREAESMKQYEPHSPQQLPGYRTRAGSSVRG